MAMPARLQDTEWTVDRALALPDDGRRHEVLDGELFVTPAPSWRHQEVIEALYPKLRDYVVKHGLGWAKLSPADIVFSPRRLLQPDLFVVPPHDGGKPRAWAEVKSLLLAVEVLSPSTAHADRNRKRVIYQNERVPEYWIVDADARLVERWRPGDDRPEIILDELTWRPREDAEPFRLLLEPLFEDVGE
jgi:Uma2 family endonuclease